MVGYDDNNNALTLGDDDALSVGEYDLEYNSSDDEWQAKFDRPIGGETGFHAEISGGSYENESQVGNTSLRLDGLDRASTTASGLPTGDSPRSISFWAFAEDGARYAVSYGSPSTNNAFCVDFGDTSNQNNEYRVVGFGNDWDTGIANTTNQWVHITVTYDGTEVIFYEDGVQQASTTSFSYNTTNNEMIIGYFIDVTNLGEDYFGLLAGVRFYDRALTSSEVSDVQSGSAVTSGLLRRYDFEYPETPNVAIDSTGEAFPKNRIPRSTNDSLVPQGLAESVSAGEALADDGNTYASVQTAVDNASGWVFVGPGTFNESVTISTAGLTLEGSGYDTLIDGATTGNAILINSSDVTVRKCSVRTSPGSGDQFDGVRVGTGGDSITVQNVVVRDSDYNGIRLTDGDDHRIYKCVVESSGRRGITHTNTPRTIISSCIVIDSPDGIYPRSSDQITANCIVNNTTAASGISTGNADGIVIGCRVSNAQGSGIYVAGADEIIANNRVSDSGNVDINDNGTGTLLDGNLTGASN